MDIRRMAASDLGLPLRQIEISGLIVVANGRRRAGGAHNGSPVVPASRSHEGWPSGSPSDKSPCRRAGGGWSGLVSETSTTGVSQAWELRNRAGLFSRQQNYTGIGTNLAICENCDVAFTDTGREIGITP
jgi:hypothetical protein